MKQFFTISLFLVSVLSTLTAQEWMTDFAEAKKMAVEEDKNIMIVFSGSDWCIPCIKLEKNILSTAIFREYLQETCIAVRADFPRKKRNQLSETLQQQNRELAERYNKSGGFPMVVMLSQDGKKLGEIGYKKITPEAYIALLMEIEK